MKIIPAIDRFMNRSHPANLQKAATISAANQRLNVISTSDLTSFGDTFRGDVIAGSGDPTDPDFTGVAILADGITINGVSYNIVGMQNGVLSFALSSSTGAAVALAGNMLIDARGIWATLLGDVLTQVADDGSTYRKLRFGMFTLPGSTAPAGGMNYQDNGVVSELVTNGTFETADLTGWTTVSGAWTVITPVAGFTGYVANTSTNNGEIKQAINVTANLTYVFTGRGQFSGSTSGKILADFYTGAGGGGSLISSNTIGILTTLPVLYTKTIMAPPTAASVVIRLINGTSTHSYFDDVSVKNVSIAGYSGFDPTTGLAIVSDTDGNPVFVAPITPSKKRMFPITSDWYNTSIASTDWIVAAIGAGTITQYSASIGNWPGWAFITQSGANTGGVFRINNSGAMQFIGGENLACIFLCASVVATAERMGFMSSTGVGAPTDGIWIAITGTTVQGVTGKASAYSFSGTTYTLTVTTAYRAVVKLNVAMTQVDFYLYSGDGLDTLLWHDSLSTNIPTASLAMIPAIVGYKTTAGTAQVLYVDWTSFWNETILAR